MNCPNCGHESKCIREMRYGKRQYRCTECNLIFRTDRPKNKHKETIIESWDSQKHICIVCGKEFWGKADRATCSRKCSGKLISQKQLKEPRATPTSTIDDFNRAYKEAEKRGRYLTYAEFQRGDY